MLPISLQKMGDFGIAVAVICVVGCGCYACNKHAQHTHMRDEPCCCETFCKKVCSKTEDEDEDEDKDFCCCENIGNCCKTQVAAEEEIITRQPVAVQIRIEVQIMIEETTLIEGTVPTVPTYNSLPTYSEVSFDAETLENYVIPAPPGYYVVDEVDEVDEVNSN